MAEANIEPEKRRVPCVARDHRGDRAVAKVEGLSLSAVARRAVIRDLARAKQPEYA